ncbi:MAG: chemotaxis protein CheX [Candidatus Binatia bacterium]
MEVTQTDLSQIVEGIWSSMLGLNIQSALEHGADSQVASLLAACIQITGAWEGSVVLRCSSELARHAAAAMFATEVESISSGEMLDSLGELANMIGGGVKSLLPEVCTLSLPTVVEGANFSLFVRGASPVQQSRFACRGEPVWVTLLEKDHPA